MQKIYKRVHRTITIEGPVEWVDRTLENSYLQENTIELAPGQYITEHPRDVETYYKETEDKNGNS